MGKKISISLSEELDQTLTSLSEENNISKNKLIENYLWRTPDHPGAEAGYDSLQPMWKGAWTRRREGEYLQVWCHLHRLLDRETGRISGRITYYRH